VPIAGYAVMDGPGLYLRGLVADVSGQHVLRAERRERPANAELLGLALAEDLLAQGAGTILRSLYEA
jgi:hydroxymethylbilane synthase